MNEIPHPRLIIHQGAHIVIKSEDFLCYTLFEPGDGFHYRRYPDFRRMTTEARIVFGKQLIRDGLEILETGELKR